MIAAGEILVSVSNIHSHYECTPFANPEVPLNLWHTRLESRFLKPRTVDSHAACAISRAAGALYFSRINAWVRPPDCTIAAWSIPMIVKTALTAIAVGALFALAAGQLVSPSKNQAKPDQLSPETVRLIDSVDGPALFKAYCAVCHGTDARGGGPMSVSLKVPPADLTRIAARNGGVYPQARVERIISGEELVPGGHGTRAMPVWGPIFSQIAWDQDLGRLRIHNLAVYIGRQQAR
jgi:mono/diheme cytochrome c family protein